MLKVGSFAHFFDHIKLVDSQRTVISGFYTTHGKTISEYWFAARTTKYMFNFVPVLYIENILSSVFAWYEKYVRKEWWWFGNVRMTSCSPNHHHSFVTYFSFYPANSYKFCLWHTFINVYYYFHYDLSHVRIHVNVYLMSLKWCHVTHSCAFICDMSRYMMSKQTMVLSILIEHMQLYCSVNAKLLSSLVKYEGCSLISAMDLITLLQALYGSARYIRWKLDLSTVDTYQTLWYIMQGCLETFLSNTAHSYHLTVFLQLSNMHFWPYIKEVL